MMATMTARALRFRSRAATELQRFISNCSGSTAIEYVVAGTLIGAGVLAGVSVLSGAVGDLYSSIVDKVSN